MLIVSLRIYFFRAITAAGFPNPVRGHDGFLLFTDYYLLFGDSDDDLEGD